MTRTAKAALSTPTGLARSSARPSGVEGFLHRRGDRRYRGGDHLPKGTPSNRRLEPGSNTLIGGDARFAPSTFCGHKNPSLDLFLLDTDDGATGAHGGAGGF
ncbi:MAG: hypothetical protein ACREMY_18930 [bacterium]